MSRPTLLALLSLASPLASLAPAFSRPSSRPSSLPSSRARLVAPRAAPRAAARPPFLLCGAAILEQAPCLLNASRALRDADGAALHRYASALGEETRYLDTSPDWRRRKRMALEVAYLAHFGQWRRSGEAYVSHPFEVAMILARLKMDEASIVSGLLHDVVEDSDVTFEQIDALFGATVRRIVEGETKVSKLPKMVRSEMETSMPDVQYQSSLRDAPTPPRDKVDEQAENLRSMFVAMAEDWRIVVVKLADRLHNMRTLKHMAPPKRISIARETLEIFAPLAHRLGMWQFRTELADLSFKYLCPAEHEQIDAFINSKLKSYERLLAAATRELAERFQTDRWLQGRIDHISVTGRTKSRHSTWKKILRHGGTAEQVNDLVALRVVVHPLEPQGEAADGGEATEPEALCYHVLGKIHGLWTPLPRTLKDYISSPKPNGYRSLHTTVLVGAQPLEIQIRTVEMHHVAEFGAAAHWAYKEGGSRASLPWLQLSVRKWRDLDCAHEFMQLVRQELLGARVFVFTANGQILNLPRGATLADAAEALGASRHAAAPQVNSRPAAPSTVLANGDIISVPHGEAREEARPPLLAAEAEEAPLEWEVCPNCLPIPGDLLVGSTDDAKGTHGVIHRDRAHCLSMRRQLAAGGRTVLAKQAGEAMLQALARSRQSRGGLLSTKIVVFTRDAPGVLLAVSYAVTKHSENIIDVHSQTQRVGLASALQYSISVRSHQQLRELVQVVCQLPDVVRVERGSMQDMMHDNPTGFWDLANPSDTT
ncbi:hypothetical protein AB1Y20_005721 [Prymnesium parvum]|uniref:GTP diphosphokinase n=1 Tax=Prymnesium parvum TaxID=97485 RepID=A0AB34J0L5_PRYPA